MILRLHFAMCNRRLSDVILADKCHQKDGSELRAGNREGDYVQTIMRTACVKCLLKSAD